MASHEAIGVVNDANDAHPEMYGLAGSTITLSCEDGQIRTWAQCACPIPTAESTVARFESEEIAISDIWENARRLLRRDSGTFFGGNVRCSAHKASREGSRVRSKTFWGRLCCALAGAWTRMAARGNCCAAGNVDPSADKYERGVLIRIACCADQVASAEFVNEDGQRILVVTLSAHPQFSCYLSLSVYEYSIPGELDIHTIRIREQVR